MKKIAILALMASFVFWSCDSKKDESATLEETEVSAEEMEIPEVPDMHTAQTSLDYTGTYKGVLPCADCEGIETVVTLNEDGTYQVTSTYLGKGEDNVFEESGNYTWKDNGSDIVLEDEDGENTMYFVAENKIIRLDMEGNRIEGALADNYVLNKED